MTLNQSIRALQRLDSVLLTSIKPCYSFYSIDIREYIELPSAFRVLPLKPTNLTF